jgi:hypothetical protein
MATEIQIRGVPAEVKAQLKRRAAAEGVSVSRYLLRLLESDLALPTRRQFREQLRSRANVKVGESAVEALEAVRSEREQQLGG